MADQAIAPAQTIRELLEQLNLHMNEPEPVILCRTCQFALSGSIKSIVDLVYDDVADRPLIRPTNITTNLQPCNTKLSSIVGYSILDQSTAPCTSFLHVRAL